MNDNKHNGLITKVWGGPAWVANHAITFGYPVEPTDVDKQNYKDYFFALGNVLPCKYCRESYNVFIRQGDTAMKDEDLTNRRSLTEWFYRLHEAVNKKLDTDYYITYEDVEERYESFRAKCTSSVQEKGCVTPLHLKAFSYKKLNYRDCPIVPIELLKPFVRIAKLRNFPDEMFVIYELANKYDGDINHLKKMSFWEERNRICQNIIDDMRENAIPSIETSGYWEDTPTNQELELLLMMCSNFDKKQLADVIRSISKKCVYFDACQ